MPQTHLTSTLATALERGFTPVPLWPGTKRPVPNDWTKLTSEDSRAAFDEALTRAAERNLTSPLNVGLVLGSGLVDVDLDHHRAAILARRLLPPTEMKHGRASSRHSHWWYRVDGYGLGVKRYNLPATDGRTGQTIIEYRSDGGQTMIPPSIHPGTGETAIWEGEPFGGELGPATVEGRTLHARIALIALLVTLAERWPTQGGRHDAYLALVGGLLRDADEDGNPRLQPFWAAQIEGLVALLVDLTHDEDGAESRIHESVTSTRRKILAGGKVRGWPTLARMLGEDGEEYVGMIREISGEIEALNGTTRNKLTRQREEDEWYDHADPSVTSLHSGEEAVDNSPSLVVIDGGEDAEAPEEEPERGTWQIVTGHDEWLDAAHNLTNPVMPGVAFRSDGVGLMYPGRVNMIYGPSESGKTLIALRAAFEEVARGGRALMIDLENGYDEIHERMQSMGLPLGMRTPGWGYIEAEQPIASLQRDSWGGEDTSPTGRKNRDYFRRALEEFDPTFILVDGTTTLFTMHGLDPNKSTGVDTITSWLRRVCDHNRRTVVMLDHTNKNPRPGDLPTGSQHKKSMVQGTMLQVHGESPEVGQTTSTTLYAVKDRPGKVKREGHKDADGVRVADVMFYGEADGSLRVTFEAPDPDSVVMDLGAPKIGRPRADSRSDVADVLSVFEQAGVGTLVRRADVEANLPREMPTARVRDAVRALMEAGRVEQQGHGRSTQYVLLPER